MAKILLSFLGTGNYSPCNYFFEDKKVSDVKFIQEAIIEIFCRDWALNDRVIIFTTKEAEEKNWNNTKTSNNTNMEGLNARIGKLKIDASNVNILIPSGMDKGANADNVQKSIWEIFDIVFTQINEQDEIILDMTHAFRFIPMLGIILLNYAKVLKNIRVLGIYYGAYEVLGTPNEISQMSMADKNAPIINLLSFSVLQSWTNAASAFVQSGNMKTIQELANDEIKPLLINSKGSDETANNLRVFLTRMNKFVNSINMCRGIDILKGEDIKALNEDLSKLENTFIKPLNPILTKIKDKVKDFKVGENIKNGLVAVEWCIDNNLIQQGITLLDEMLISAIILEVNEDYADEDVREVVSKCVNIKTRGIPEKDWMQEVLSRKDLAYKILGLPLFAKLCNTFQSIKDFRNDINHAGFRKKTKPRDSDKFKNKLVEVFNEIKFLLEFRSK